MDSTSLPIIGDLRAEDWRIQELALVLSQDYPDAEPEPEPQLDYLWLNSLLSVCRKCLHDRDIKCADYVAQARQHYYCCHQKFHHHYRGLQDCLAYSYILDRQQEKLLASGSPDEAKLKEIDRQHTLNDNDMVSMKEKLVQCAKNRKEATAWFSKAKADFIKTEMPRLEYCAKHIYENYAAREGSVRPCLGFLQQRHLTFSSGTCTSEPSKVDRATHVNGVAGASEVDHAIHVNGFAGASGIGHAHNANGVTRASGAGHAHNVNGVAGALRPDGAIHVNGAAGASGAGHANNINGVTGASGAGHAHNINGLARPSAANRMIHVNGVAGPSGAGHAHNVNGTAGAVNGEFSGIKAWCKD
ncbi:MAG: hypothetical protein LQ351_001691 [Letrouitia transgressa]|nr:MAG: hypothetical protein LQ351_001691 [Letrouitia transgressa]